MNRRLRILTAGLFVLCICARFWDVTGHAQQAASSQVAQQIFLARCSTCHAEHGEGSEVGASLNVPDLRSREVQNQKDGTLRQVIREGRGDMPTFKRDFTEDEVNQLIQLVRSFAHQNAEKKKEGSEERGDHQK